MGSSGLYRIPTEIAVDFSKTEEELASAVERVADKPLSDGIRKETSTSPILKTKVFTW